jgi:hypothetical protein
MATPITERIARALRSPQAQRLTERAKEIAKDPATRAKIETRIDKLRARLTKKR